MPGTAPLWSVEVDLCATEGALLRVIGTIERRGFRLLQLNSGPLLDNCWSLRLTLSGGRDPHVLCRQLLRLIDVRDARLLQQEPFA